MQIDSLATLRKVLKLCRESGVTSIEIDGIKMSIALISSKRSNESSIFDNLELPPEASAVVPQYNPSNTIQEEAERISTESLTEEQILFYSSRPEDPGVQDRQ